MFVRPFSITYNPPRVKKEQRKKKKRFTACQPASQPSPRFLVEKKEKAKEKKGFEIESTKLSVAKTREKRAKISLQNSKVPPRLHPQETRPGNYHPPIRG